MPAEVTVADLVFAREPDEILVRQQVRRVRDDGEDLQMPHVVGDQVVKHAASVAAARILGRLKIGAWVSVAGDGGPRMAPILPLTVEQEFVIRSAHERMREILGDPGLSRGRALELMLAHLMSGEFGWPGHPVPRLLSQSLNLDPRRRRDAPPRPPLPLGAAEGSH